MKIILLVFLILLGIFGTIYIFSITFGRNKEYDNEIKVDKTYYQLCNHKSRLYDSYTFMVLRNDNLQINNNLELFSLLSDTNYKLKSIIAGKRKLLFRYNDRHCDECVNAVVNKLKKIANEVGENNILILSSYSSDRDFKICAQYKGIERFAYHTSYNGLGLPLEDQSTPFLFTVGPDMKVADIFIPVKEFPEQIDLYFSIVKSKYFQ